MNASPATPNKHVLAASALLFLLALALYFPAIKNSFVTYDDPAYVTNNPRVQQGLSVENVRWAFTTFTEANWHPLTWLSHMVDVSIFGLNPAGHHFTSVLLHAVNVLLLFWLLLAFTGRIGRSACVAALFAVHPLNVETVAWISERKSLLSTLFFFFAIAAYAAWTRRPSVLRYLLLILFFALGLLAKPMIVTLPFALILLDYWPLERLHFAATSGGSISLKRSIVEKLPLFLLAGASVGVTIAAQRQGGAVGTASSLPFSFRLTNAIYSYSLYLWKTLIPARLAVFYPHPEGHLSLALVILSALFLVAVTILVCRFRSTRFSPVGWFWYLGILFPVIGIVQVGRQALADRYAYLPLIGIFVIAVWGIADVAEKFSFSPKLLGIVAAAVLFGYSSATILQLSYWKDGFTLFQHTLAVTQNNGLAELNFGKVLVDRGRPDLAEPHFRNAIRFSPDLGLPHYDLGTLLQQQGRADEALQEFQLALPRLSDALELAQVHNNIGAILLDRRQYPQALQEFNVAIQLNSEEANSFLGKGIVQLQIGDAPGAQSTFQHAAQIAPNSPAAWYWLGRALEARSATSDAMRAYQHALQLAPAFAEARSRLDALTAPNP